MILRKPYAFLIKYFKIIHIIMFIFFSYLVFSLRKIYMFFVNYIKTSNFVYVDGMASEYITPIMFIMVLLILVAAIFIYSLMRKKEKPVLFYKILIVYSLILLGVFIYFFSFFKSLEFTVYEPLQIVVNRDIMLFVYYLNFVYVVFTFIRGFGFDIKKFSFDRDKKELNLEETDNEEYELNIGIDKENVVNYLRKEKREFRYYLKENAVILSIIGSLIIIILGLYIYFNFFVFNKVYKQNEIITIGKINYQVNYSAITNLNKYGEIISNNSDFLLVDVKIQNQAGNGTLDKENFRVRINDEYFYPLTTYCDAFEDVGTCYVNQKLKNNTANNYVLIYKIKKEHTKIYFEILKSKKSGYEYSKMLLSPQNIEKEINTIKITDNFKIDGKELSIINHDIVETTSYKYEECANEVCNTFTKTIIPKLNDKVLVLTINNLEAISKETLDKYVGIVYDGKKVNSKNLKIIDKNKDSLYISVPKEAMTSENLSFLLSTRYHEYNIILRSKNNE